MQKVEEQLQVDQKLQNLHKLKIQVEEQAVQADQEVQMLQVAQVVQVAQVAQVVQAVQALQIVREEMQQEIKSKEEK